MMERSAGIAVCCRKDLQAVRRERACVVAVQLPRKVEQVSVLDVPVCVRLNSIKECRRACVSHLQHFDGRHATEAKLVPLEGWPKDRGRRHRKRRTVVVQLLRLEVLDMSECDDCW